MEVRGYRGDKNERVSDFSEFLKVKGDILSRFILASEDNQEEMTNQYLRDIILNFLIAGKDTTTNTLSWFFYMLCKNPLVQEKINDEIKCSTNSMESGAKFEDFMMTLSEEAIDRMQYLHAALTETLRLYPAVPWAEEGDGEVEATWNNRAIAVERWRSNS